MTQAEKLEALVRRAFENSWEGFGHCRGAVLPWYIVSAGQMPTPKVVESWVPKNTLLIAGLDDYYFVWERVLFDREGVARALFGDGPYYKLNDPKRTVRKLWEHELQQAVISKDPIGYMYKAVFGD